MKTQRLPRWAPTINRAPRLEYGLWETKKQAEAAAREIALFTRAAKVGACRVFYRVEREQPL